MVLFLKILAGFAAVALGIFLGVGENRQTPDEMGQLLGRGKPRKSKRHFMWINYMKADQRASQRRAKRRYFKTATSTRVEVKRSADGPGGPSESRPGGHPDR